MIKDVARVHARSIVWFAAASALVVVTFLAAFEMSSTVAWLGLWAGSFFGLLAWPGFRNFRTSTLTVALGILLGLTMLEVGTRLRYFGPDGVLHFVECRPEREETVARIRDPDAEKDGRLARLKPNLDTWYRGARFKVNSVGYRGEEFRAMGESSLRAAFFGDSFTLGFGVPNEATYASLVERNLRERGFDSNPESMNFALPGEPLPTLVKRIQEEGLSYVPDVVIVGVSRPMTAGPKPPNPERPQVSKFRGKKMLEVIVRGNEANPIGMVNRSILQRHFFVLQSRPRLEGLENWLVRRGLIDEITKVRSSSIADVKIRASFEELSEIHRSSGVPIYIVLIRPMNFEPPAPGPPWNEQVAALAREFGLPVLDTTEAFPLGARTLDYALYPGDSHANRRAHRVFAKTILEGVSWKELATRTHP